MEVQLKIIENIYDCFSPYSAYVPFDGSPYKEELIKEMNVLLTKDIRLYDWNDGSPFSSLPLCIIWTVGDSYQYKRFLPRVLDLAVTQDSKNNYNLLETSMYLKRVALDKVEFIDKESELLSKVGVFWLKKYLTTKSSYDFECHDTGWDFSYSSETLASIFCLDKSFDFWKGKINQLIITDNALYRLSELILDSSQNKNKDVREIDCPIDDVDYILDLFQYLGSVLDTKLKGRLEEKFFNETESDKQELLSYAIQAI